MIRGARYSGERVMERELKLAASAFDGDAGHLPNGAAHEPPCVGRRVGECDWGLALGLKS